MYINEYFYDASGGSTDTCASVGVGQWDVYLDSACTSSFDEECTRQESYDDTQEQDKVFMNATCFTPN